MQKSSLFLFFAAILISCDSLRSFFISKVDKHDAVAEERPKNPKPKFDQVDEAKKIIRIKLNLIADGFAMPVGFALVPGEKELALVLEKNGALKWLNLNTKKVGTLLRLRVQTSSEEGLLGIAFHPDFLTNRRVYLNYVVEDEGKDKTLVSEFTWRENQKLGGQAFKFERTLLEVEQPYPNHNAGDLAFGPDGGLYVGFGDGGWRDDPKGNGQNQKTFLGSMLRLNVDETNSKEKKFIPEVWAIGLRNPWRYSFSPDGRLIVADVGQDSWEEIDIVEKGDNLGWNIKEGFSCFRNDKRCGQSLKLKDPIYAYGRSEGISITGGFVYTGRRVKELIGKYVFADYGSKRIWAIDLPKIGSNARVEKAGVYALGEWPIQIASFGIGPDADLYALDFSAGGIYRFE